MSIKHLKKAVAIDSPLLKAACQKFAKPGFVPVSQSIKSNDPKIISKAREKYGRENCHVEPGHFQLIKEGGRITPVRFKNGCILFVSKAKLDLIARRKNRLVGLPPVAPTDPDWTRTCPNCDESPVVPETGLCGPCTFGEADTANGNW